MEKTAEITISAHLNSGEPIVFKQDLTEDSERKSGTRIEQSMNSNFFGVKMDGKLILIPTSSIQKVEISPAPEAKISHVIKGARSA
jgi:hypothetical protein